MNIKKTTILLALAILILGAGSCFAIEYCSWYCYDYGTSDWFSSSGCGSGSCGSGGGSGIDIDLSHGWTFYGANIPGGYPGAASSVPWGYGGRLSRICFSGSGIASIATACGCINFTVDPNNNNSWINFLLGMTMTTTRDGEGEITAATVTSPNGSTITYDFQNGGSLPSETCDASGAVTTYDIANVVTAEGYPPIYDVQSVTLPDGREYQYGHDEYGNLVGVTYPDGKVHMLISGNLATPYFVAYVDPDSYDEQQGEEGKYILENYEHWTATAYLENEYYIDSIKLSDAVGSVYYEADTTVTRVYKGDTMYEVVLDNPYYVEFHPELFPENTPPKCYSMTKISKDVQEEDEVDYGVTTIRKYADPSEIWQWDEYYGWYCYPSVDPTNSDRVTEHWYYRNDGNTANTFLRKNVVKWYEDSSWQSATTTYTRITDDEDPLYGQITSVVDPLSRETTYDYYDPDVDYDVSDPEVIPYPTTNGTVAGNGEIRQVTYPGSYTTAYNYKVVSSVMKPFVIRAEDTSGYVTKYEVNTDGTVAEVWNQIDSSTLVKTESYTYYTTPNSHKGLVNTETVYDVSSDDDDMVTTYDYTYSSGACTVTATVENGANDRVTQTHYNILGQMDWSQDEYDRQTDYTYDWQSRSLVTTFPQVTGEGSRKTVENEYGCCTLNSTEDENHYKAYYGYDEINRTTKTWTDITGQGTGDPLAEYTYNYFGQVATTVTQSDDSTDRTTTYTYDNRGLLTKTTYPYASIEGDLLGSEEYLYDDIGRLVAKKDGNGDITAYEYDDLDRLTEVDYDYATFEIPTITSADVTYTYQDAKGLVTDIDETIDGASVTTSYEYDRLGRITEYTPPLPVGYGSITYEWNNLSQKTSMTVPMGFTGNNNARVYEYNYDMTGRQTGMDTSAATVTSNSTLASNVGASADTTFCYSATEDRVKLITKAGDVYYFVYDPTAAVPSVVYEAVNDGGTRMTYLNARDSMGGLISRDTYEGAVRTQSRTYHFDGLGSAVALTDEDGVVTDTYTYDGWGNATHATGSTADNPYQYVGQLGYYTHYQEPTFGMLQLGVRYYDPSTGRFTQLDPIGDGLNWYAYVGGNVLTRVDPSGFCSSALNPALGPALVFALDPALEITATVAVGVVGGTVAAEIVNECERARSIPRAIDIAPPMPRTQPRKDECTANWLNCIKIVDRLNVSRRLKSALYEQCSLCKSRCNANAVANIVEPYTPGYSSWWPQDGRCNFLDWLRDPGTLPIF